MKKLTNREFFDYLFNGLEGYLALATIDRREGKKKFKEHFFKYPDDMEEALIFIEKNKNTLDVYFAPFLTVRQRRKKEDIVETPVAWSDGDDCPIQALKLPPSIIIRTSKNRHSFLWKFVDVQGPSVGESISKRIAYFHKDEGMDSTGWDLTQLLRVPNTYNHKYSPPQMVSPAVQQESAIFDLDDFSDTYPELSEEDDPERSFTKLSETEFPDKNAKEILEEYKDVLNPRAFDLFGTVPQSDWSSKLWELELTLAEGGMTPQEVFIVAESSLCNKYKRDNRPKGFLWQEVQRAHIYAERRRTEPPPLDIGAPGDAKAPQLLTDEQRELVKSDVTFIEEYTNWAKTLGDAAEVYHPVGAFVILSTLLSANVKLPTSFGTVIPNLWFMILADTTLTRKSTAMDNAVDMLLEVDYESLLATDGSVEGLMTAMSTRAGKSSLFLRDEVTGLIESLKKEYMAGMMETLTKLYDGKPLKRILRRETIDVRDPVLILFSGGIRNKMIEILDYKHVTSGFLPRFIFVTAESDITRLKPIGPPTRENLKDRLRLMRKCKALHETYVVPKPASDGKTVTLPKQWVAELTPEAWDLYNSYEMRMLEFAVNSHDPTLLTPMMDRLAKSGLKASVLIAASRMNSEKNVTVGYADILHAFYYIEQWAKHSLYIINNIGTTKDENSLQRVLIYIDHNPGALRSNIMQRYRMNAREAENVFNTLEQRNQIRREKRGSRGERVYPI